MQIDDDASDATSTPDELRRAIDCRLWLPTQRSQQGLPQPCQSNARLPRRPHPDGPTRLTTSQLSDAQLQLDQAHVDQKWAEYGFGEYGFKHRIQ